MHKRLRVSFTKCHELIQEHLRICGQTLAHMEECAECTDEAFCPVGTILYDQFRAIRARARLVIDDVKID